MKTGALLVGSFGALGLFLCAVQIGQAAIERGPLTPELALILLAFVVNMASALSLLRFWSKE